MERMLAARQDGLHKEGTKGEKGKKLFPLSRYDT